jgi:hypothetical protein
MPNSVATLRIATAIDDQGKATVRGCYLRFGRAADSHVVASHQVRVPTEVRTGRLSSEGFLADWSPVDRHPDTGRTFEGHQIPGFADCIATVLKLHAAVPHTRCVSWDVTVDDAERVRVMEWEGAVISFVEATQGPCFADLGWDKLHRKSPTG